MEERISGTENSIRNMDKAIKENAKFKKTLTQNIQEIQNTMRRPKQQKTGIDEYEVPLLVFLISLDWNSILFDIRMATPAWFFKPLLEKLFSSFHSEDVLYGIFCT